MSKVKVVVEDDMHPIFKANQLTKHLEGDEQMLVFLPGVADVREAVKIFDESYHKTSYPLFANQDPKEQDKFINLGQVFFSTTIAETSLTFKNLKFVIDSGKIRVPVYDHKKRATELLDIRAPDSTLSQRKGRLGRLQTIGTYYLCSDKALHTLPFLESEIEKMDILDVYFSVLRCTKDLDTSYVKKVMEAIPVNNENILKEKIKFAEIDL